MINYWKKIREIIKRGFEPKNIFLNVFGIFYILIALLAFYDSVNFLGIQSILWLSYFAFLFIGIGILIRSSYLIGSQINIIFIPYTIWCIDFFYVLFTSKSLFGITNFIFVSEQILPLVVTLQHLTIIPVALMAIYLIKFKRKDFWKFSLVQVAIIFILTLIFSEQSNNINCVFKNCLPFEVGEYYLLAWVVTYIIMIFLVNFILIKIKDFSKKSKKFK